MLPCIQELHTNNPLSFNPVRGQQHFLCTPRLEAHLENGGSFNLVMRLDKRVNFLRSGRGSIFNQESTPCNCLVPSPRSVALPKLSSMRANQHQQPPTKLPRATKTGNSGANTLHVKAHAVPVYK
jgi:hypothetical protein